MSGCCCFFFTSFNFIFIVVLFLFSPQVLALFLCLIVKRPDLYLLISPLPAFNFVSPILPCTVALLSRLVLLLSFASRFPPGTVSLELGFLQTFAFQLFPQCGLAWAFCSLCSILEIAFFICFFPPLVIPISSLAFFFLLPFFPVGGGYQEQPEPSLKFILVHAEPASPLLPFALNTELRVFSPVDAPR